MESLRDRALSLRGMIAEVRAKCVLLQNKIQESKEQAIFELAQQGIVVPDEELPVPQEFYDYINERAAKLREDLDKYTQEFLEVCAKLEAHGDIDVYPMEEDEGGEEEPGTYPGLFN